MQNITREFSGHSSRESITEIPAHLQAVQGQVMPSLDTNTGWEPPDSTKNRAGPPLNTSSCVVSLQWLAINRHDSRTRTDWTKEWIWRKQPGTNLNITEQQDGPPEPEPGHTDTSRSDSHTELLSLRFFRNCNPEAAPGGVHQTDVKRGDVSFRLEFCQTFTPEPAESVSPGVSQRRSVSELLLDWSKDTFSHFNTCCPAQICGNDG